jgi:TP53 regulating kinase-like protein
LEKLIYRGAEADLYLRSWAGKKAIAKVRVDKEYMPPELNLKIKRHRTATEAAIMVKARRLGVPTPLVFFVDCDSGLIVMQYITGVRLRDLHLTSSFEAVGIFEQVGECIGALHKGGLIHGDLNTSNFIMADPGKVVFIDFGLAMQSARIEDRAVDLHLLKGILNSAHRLIARDALQATFNGYSTVVGERTLRSTIEKVSEIESRGRYARVV